ncbi:hypothetical protein ACJMK2_041731 [Sinanodonta woodiana]|uniref:Uncharacterized protein n=1 Tax=Sinanodonta woodiana TaxID=1069815 RepID=A0ABD3W8D2_SINWO
MSELQPPITVPEEKVLSNVDAIYSKIVRPIKAGSADDPRSIEERDLSRKKQSPPSFKPPPPPVPPPLPPPRLVTTQPKSPTSKQKEHHSSENQRYKKRPKGCNFEEKTADRTRPDYNNVSEFVILDEECHASALGHVNVKTKETFRLENNTDSTTVLPNPKIRHDFDRISQIPDAVKDAYMTKTFTKCKRDKSIDTIKEETSIIDNSNIQVTSVKRDTTTVNNIDKHMGTAGKGVDIMCNVHFKFDSDEGEIENDEEGYVLMGYVEAKSHVISQAKSMPFRALSKTQLVKRLEECGLKDLAAVCENEKLDGQFLAKHVSDEDLMQDPFLLTRFQIKKLRAIIDGWRPISDFHKDFDTSSG